MISPLIALMDDQVHKLKERGFAVECIHSGRDRETSRRVCSEYLGGRLQFLFIAPERLRVAGFPEMLAHSHAHLVRRGRRRDRRLLHARHGRWLQQVGGAHFRVRRRSAEVVVMRQRGHMGRVLN